jgi:L-ascorbate metabolism protein UlaG (beta-lactamase superfamily)
MVFECGFETVGNATLILHDGGPILATDPWIGGSAYFGSWGLAHEIPAEQLEAVRRCKYLWISHGHPDHLSGDSLEQLTDRIILLPDHRGARIHDDLRAQGFNVEVLPEAWCRLRTRL